MPLNYFSDDLKLFMNFFQDNQGRSSKSNDSASKYTGRAITDADYESASSPENHDKNYNSDSDSNEALVSKYINQNIETFKANLNTLTNEELVETLDIIEDMIGEYKRSNVPSAEQQILILEEKHHNAVEQLEKNMHESENSNIQQDENKNKGKGKEIDNNKNK